MKMLLPAVLAPLLLAVSCAPSTPQARIEQNPGLFARLSSRDRDLASHGQLARGMSPDAVYIAWGAPSHRFEGNKGGKNLLRWDYTSSEPVYHSGFYGGFGGGYGYTRYGRYGYRTLGYGFGPEVDYVPSVAASVTFLDRRVDAWERRR